MSDYNMWRICRNLAKFCDVLAKRENDKRFAEEAERFRKLSKFFRGKKR